MKQRTGLHTLGGQLIAVMLLALAASYGLTFILSLSERNRAVYETRRVDCISRTAAIASLVSSLGDEFREDILRSVNTPYNRYWLSGVQTEAARDWQAEAIDRLGWTSGGVASTQASREHTSVPDVSLRTLKGSEGQWESIAPTQRGVAFSGRYMALPSWNGVGVALRIRDGLYLNSLMIKPPSATPSGSTLPMAFAVSAVAVSIASVLIAGRIGRPLRELADQAERLGRGELVDIVLGRGPDDVRSTAAAINQMLIRQRRFVEDRTNMVAAISHDLRTPITSLRLRAEFIADVQLREKIIGTLDDLQAMMDATLGFAREDAVLEPTRLVDLSALIRSLSDDLVELGWDVRCKDDERFAFACRPESLSRAVRNVIENAIRYGDVAHVHLDVHPHLVEIIVRDEGPGIPPEELDRVFSPFVRLEASRSRQTGGVGLGLSIARTVIHAHGGVIQIENLTPGLRVRLQLPRRRDVRDDAMPTTQRQPS